MMMWVLTKVAALLVLGVLVLVHEFGHFIVAKWCGVGVLKFAIGFGPPLCKFRRGETEYQIGPIPLGGYVRMVGDIPDPITGTQATDNAVRVEEFGVIETVEKEIPFQEQLSPEAQAMIQDRSRWFIEKGFWPKSAIVVAGPVFNLLLTVFLIFACLTVYGERKMETTPRLGSIMLGSPAEQAGLKDGDIVKTIDGKEITTWENLAATIRDGTGAPVKLQVLRDGKEMEFQAQPQPKSTTVNGVAKTSYFLGFLHPGTYTHDPVPLGQAAKEAVLATAENVMSIYYGIWSIFQGTVSAKELAGPIYIFQAAGQQAEKGLEDLFYFVAILSVSLAVLNLLPIPILDGGHLMFFIIEALLGPISMRKKEVAQQVGFALLLSLMVFAFKNDIFRKSPEESKGPQKWETFGEPAPAKKP